MAILPNRIIGTRNCSYISRSSDTEIRAQEKRSMRELEMEYLTRDEVAKTLRISTRTLDRIVADGDLVGARVGGRRLLFRKQDVDGYVRGKLQEAVR